MKRLNFNIKDRKILTLGLCMILVCVFTLTIAYAALSAVLTIQGNAQVSSANWDIHLDNVKVTSGSVSGTTPSITSPTTATFSTTLNMPGDFYEFTIDVVNGGSIDAMIENITKTPTLSTEQAKYLKYDITYQNGESITTKQLVEKESFVRLKVRLEFRNDITSSDLPTSSETLSLGLQLDYTQSDGTGTTVPNNGVGGSNISANGSLDAIGTVVTIGSEQFYTIGTEGNNVKLLSMYNLMVGNEVNISDDGDPIATPLANSTGLQSEDAIGLKWDAETESPIGFPWYGTVAFATEDKHGTNYSDYSGSLIETYVNDYAVKLESMGVNIESARLITKEELIGLGCNDSEYTCTGTDYPWIYSTSYWSGSAHDDSNVWDVISNGYFDSGSCDSDAGAGVRPVIIISKSIF